MKTSCAANTLKVAMVGLLFSAASFSQASGITFTFAKIVDSFEAIPGQPGATFTIPGGLPGEPANSGKRISFVALPPSFIEQLWTADATGGTLVKLVDSNTPLPGGTGNCVNGYEHRFFGATVVVQCSSSTDSGLYSVPATGGTLVKLADQNTPRPDGTGTLGGFANLPFDVDHGNVVFSTSPTGASFAVPAKGGTLTEPLDTTKFGICESGYDTDVLNSYSFPDLSSNTMAFVAAPAGSGEGAIYSAPLTGLTGVSDPCAKPLLKVTNATRIASLNTAVPGDPHGRNFYSLTFVLPQISGSHAVFGGAAQPLKPGGPIDLAGLYSKNLTTGVLTKLVDSNTPVPGGTGKFQFQNGFPFNSPGWTVSGGNFVFTGMDAAGNIGIYLVSTAGGPISKIIRDGDKLPGGRVVKFFSSPIQSDSLSGRSLAFSVQFTDPVLGTGNGIYLASF